MLEVSNDLSDEFLGVLEEVSREYPDAPPTTVDEIEDEGAAQRKRRRHRKGENSQPTPLQIRYQRQIRNEARASLADEMAKLVAWTFLPGKDRTACPPFVDIRDARLMVMDRFPADTGGACSRIALSMYRGSVRGSEVNYAHPETIELFKDFSIRPHFRAGGLCLDSRNEEVFKVALALDQAMELAARGKIECAQTFSPPLTWFGFPQHFIPSPEWRTPMQDEVRRMFHPSTPVMRCLLSPGGKVTEVQENKVNYHALSTIVLSKEGNLINIKVPNWLVLSPELAVGAETKEGQPLADLPRGEYGTIKDVTQKYPFKALEWLERRILEELTETISVEEDVYNKQTQQREPRTTTWRCLPSQFIQTSAQAHRVVRCFLDFRNHLGRQKYAMSYDGLECGDNWTEDLHQARIDVLGFDNRPTAADLLYFSGQSEQSSTWRADLMTAPPNAVWVSRCPCRGVA